MCESPLCGQVSMGSACPDANHEVCMLLVNILNHLWAINKVF